MLEPLFNEVIKKLLKLYKKETPTQAFPCEYWINFKNTYFQKHLRTAALIHSIFESIQSVGKKILELFLSIKLRLESTGLIGSHEYLKKLWRHWIKTLDFANLLVQVWGKYQKKICIILIFKPFKGLKKEIYLLTSKNNRTLLHKFKNKGFFWEQRLIYFNLIVSIGIFTNFYLN